MNPVIKWTQRSTAGINVVMIQVNFFKCGGIALSFCTSHKIIDRYTCITFLKAWADTMQGFALVCPSVIPSNSLFPQNPALLEDSTLVMWPSLLCQSRVSDVLVMDVRDGDSSLCVVIANMDRREELI
ncbi:hypothetical protein RHMOL_Rhmol13G0186200 [Rhododendron molle]|uniref:Uncharacterized protein n=1 Tax=Rhododendron molle TaxID=49168 RepID=A0ACC0L8S2_RHOML|nr:hypothetical protein RHMOL_Rhmol13G0186200 [Rhododendron molle]